LEGKGVYADRTLHPLPDVVVVDLKMPRVSGFDLLAWRKASRLFSSIPIVILSGSKNPAEIKRADEMGANKHIAKTLKIGRVSLERSGILGRKTLRTFKPSRAGPVRMPQREPPSFGRPTLAI
jgi:DNA-binding response OmpR family regulator